MPDRFTDRRSRSPGAELGQYRDELDRGFGEAVGGPLPGARVVAGEQAGSRISSLLIRQTDCIYHHYA
jgi:hypothetical protein